MQRLFLMVILSLFISIPTFGLITEEQEKIIYLTFDDGPTQGITENILDTLKQEDVKATFFVVGREIIQREPVLKRIHEEGHAFGLHTFTHDYKKVYASPESFVKEMEETQKKINEILNEDLDVKVIRFPGGSAGKLNQQYFDAIKKKGYRIFDWNVNIEDGVQPNLPPYKFVENSKICSDNNTTRILLAHCNLNNLNTCKALPAIIRYYKEQGYTFDIITNDTKEYYYKFKDEDLK
ncbi:polysaccharide deacetylase [Candidatus Epulonipiscium fishelsonii]|uniref:Polysaccharide deacetylase n=1 Tax=Candidatus Epulonipiscium fishelsonii TaxID=77094 RepID=A0ACC8XDA3_9FIRM|nr:polysaccharide deacetylase [Epulopiscium sp. SCG-B05WGA-EpuloA1]ONI40767.1 polysaccharide deacetylase [Epulopiscium sp. SCG-B11WGA-EpuloA1]